MSGRCSCRPGAGSLGHRIPICPDAAAVLRPSLVGCGGGPCLGPHGSEARLRPLSKRALPQVARSPWSQGCLGEGEKGLKLGCAGQGAHPPARSPLMCEVEAGVGREEEQMFVGGWGTLDRGPVLPRSSFSGKETEESENSNIERGLPGHYKGIFVKLRDLQVLALLTRFITCTYIDSWQMDFCSWAFPGPANASRGQEGACWWGSPLLPAAWPLSAPGPVAPAVGFLRVGNVPPPPYPAAIPGESSGVISAIICAHTSQVI